MDTEQLDLTLPDLTAVELDLGNRVVVRNFKDSDAEDIFATVHRNIDHLHFMHWIKPDYSLNDAFEFLERSKNNAEKGESLSLGIFADDAFIGSIGFVHFEMAARRTEIGYWIDAAFEGTGVISRACERLIDYAFNDLGMNRIEIRCSAENMRSAAIPKRFGFKKEAHLRQQELRQGRLHDFLIFGLLRSEWESKGCNL
ncbi:MAG: GNAT family protein [Pyrinomonadaceae bacterium]